MKDYPAIDVRTGEPDVLLAIVDDFGPIALEEIESAGTVRVFFPTATDRDAAHRALADRYDTAAVEVSDEDWARRSQENLKPITVGRITVFPRPHVPSPYSIVIIPSMGFGTGHHATTRLCLEALQMLDLTNRAVLDVGTGSGVLALAAERLGAARAVGIDSDPDAIQSARENLELNPANGRVSFEVIDLAAAPLPVVDVVTANLTGALLVRSAGVLLAAVTSGGTLILSGMLAHERDQVCRAFAPAAIVWERDEDGWIGLTMKKA